MYIHSVTPNKICISQHPSNHLYLQTAMSLLFSSVQFSHSVVSQFFTLGGWSIGASASPSVLPIYLKLWLFISVILIQKTLLSKESHHVTSPSSNNCLMKFCYFFKRSMRTTGVATPWIRSSFQGQLKLLNRVQHFMIPWTTIHEILQGRILEWVVFPFSKGSPQTRDWTQVFCIVGGSLTSWATREGQEYWSA